MLSCVAAVPVMLTAMACYEYQPSSVSAIHRDERVHVVLSQDASASLASSIGPNATSLDGRVLSVDATSVRLAVTQIARAAGPEEFLKDEPIEVPRAGASVVTVRSFDRLRTFLAIGGLVAGAIAAHSVTDSPGVVAIKGGPPGSTK